MVSAIDLAGEARQLRAAGYTAKMLRNELGQREIPADEVRYFGKPHADIKNSEGDLLGKYSNMQLAMLEKEIKMQESVANDMEEQEMLVKQSDDKVVSMDIYDEIRSRLANSSTKEELEESYKWLAEQFVISNETGKRFENKFIEKYGEREFGILLYGSEEAYEKEVAFERKLQDATPDEREVLFLEKLLGDDSAEEEPDFPELW